MPKIYSSKELIRKLKTFGFIKHTQKWSHLKMIHGNKTVIVPIHAKDIPFWTFRSILEQANISYEDFELWKR